MRIRQMLAVILLGVSLSAAADFKTITQAYEVALGDLRLPANTGGTLAFKQCPKCDAQALRVKSSTRYVLNGRTVTLQRFKERLSVVKNSDDVAATVLHHLESNTITGVKVRISKATAARYFKD